MGITSPARALEWQADHAENNSAPATARLIRAFRVLLESDTACGRRMRDWPGLLLEDAMPLRLAGGFHNLLLTGADRRLAPVYAGEVTQPAEVEALVLTVARDHDARLAGWLDGPPQTNEAARSGAIVAGLLWLAARLGSRFELNEIGASAGINIMIERYFYELGGVRVGPADSPMRIRPQWRGLPPPAETLEITGIAGCDQAPIDLADPEQALRLKSYVWPDTPERLDRIEAAIELARQRRPALEASDAQDWVRRRLATPQPEGVTRTLYHSIVWQYLPDAARRAIAAMMEQAGALASAARPLAWVQLETNRATFRHELCVRYWPGGETPVKLGEAHAHGAWVEWSPPAGQS